MEGCVIADCTVAPVDRWLPVNELRFEAKRELLPGTSVREADSNELDGNVDSMAHWALRSARRHWEDLRSKAATGRQVISKGQMQAE